MAYEHMTSVTGMAMIGDRRSVAALAPGFRFHPTDEELILHYLRNRVASLPCPVPIITELDIYKFNPWDLPGKAVFGEKEWYFFTPRDRKYPNGVRPNRAAGSGYWKATGTDKPIVGTGRRASIGVKKALVFYIGKPPKGTKTGWIMHEYRLAGPHAAAAKPVPSPDSSSMRLDDWVLCRIYQKNCPSDRREELAPMEVYASPPSANITQGTPPDVRDFESHALARFLHGGDPAGFQLGDADLLSMAMMGQDTLGSNTLGQDDGFAMWQRMLEGCSAAAMDEGEEMLNAYGFHPGFSGRPFGL